MATIKDVAARAGVALGTASRVLNGSEKTSENSRHKVLKAASDLNYVAHGPARALRRFKTDVLGLLVSDIRNPFFSELAHAAEQEARRLGYTVLLANSNEDSTQLDEYLGIFAAERVDGVLLAPQSELGPQLAGMKASGMPLVLLNRTVKGIDAPMYGTDNVSGVLLALQWLQHRGHRDVAFVGGPPEITTGAERLETYLAGRQRHGITLDDKFIATGDFRKEGGARAMRNILERGVCPTAVFGANGQTTLGAVHALREWFGESGSAGIELVSFDDLEWFDLVSPPISSVRNDGASIGRLAVAGLVDLIEGRTASSARVATSFVDRMGGADHV